MRWPRRWIVWLRGINVAGKRKLPMADLRSLLEDLGATDVRTYIQSGNAVFTPSGPLAALTETELEAQISAAIERRCGYDVPVMARRPHEVALALAFTETRFAAELDADPSAEKITLVHFLSAVPAPDRTLDPERSPADTFVLEGRELHVHYSEGSGRSKLTPAWIESSLAVRATSRNVRTLRAVLDLV